MSAIRHGWRNLLLALWVIGVVLWTTGIVLVPNAAAQSDVSPHLTIVTGALNVRSGPGVTYPAVNLLMRGDEVPVIGQHAASGWWQVRLPDGGTGWVSGGVAYVSVDGDTKGVPEVPAAFPSGAGVEAVTATAFAATPNTGGTIIFQTLSGGPIYVVDADGSNLRYLTTGMDPALSPDGQWVAFTRWEDTQISALAGTFFVSLLTKNTLLVSYLWNDQSSSLTPT